MRRVNRACSVLCGVLELHLLTQGVGRSRACTFTMKVIQSDLILVNVLGPPSFLNATRERKCKRVCTRHLLRVAQSRSVPSDIPASREIVCSKTTAEGSSVLKNALYSTSREALRSISILIEGTPSSRVHCSYINSQWLRESKPNGRSTSGNSLINDGLFRGEGDVPPVFQPLAVDLQVAAVDEGISRARVDSRLTLRNHSSVRGQIKLVRVQKEDMKQKYRGQSNHLAQYFMNKRTPMKAQ